MKIWVQPLGSESIIIRKVGVGWGCRYGDSGKLPEE